MKQIILPLMTLYVCQPCRTRAPWSLPRDCSTWHGSTCFKMILSLVNPEQNFVPMSSSLARTVQLPVCTRCQLWICRQLTLNAKRADLTHCRSADQLVHAMNSCLEFLGAMQHIQNYYYCKWAVWHWEILDRQTVWSRINERAVST